MEEMRIISKSWLYALFYAQMSRFFIYKGLRAHLNREGTLMHSKWPMKLSLGPVILHHLTLMVHYLNYPPLCTALATLIYSGRPLAL